jgi:mycothione reductase
MPIVNLAGVDHFDLAIIGSGSGNSLVTPYFADKRVAIVEVSTFGGTCLNVGCIPTKMFVYAAEVAGTVRHAHRYGIDARIERVRWHDIRNRVFGRIDPISAGGLAYRTASENTTVLHGEAVFDGPLSFRVDGSGPVSADQIVIAAGSRPTIPELIKNSGVPFHTSDTVMRIEALPDRITIVGGGYIAAEFAHIFSSLGVEVSLVTRGPALLRAQDDQISATFTRLAASKWKVYLDAVLAAAKPRSAARSGPGYPDDAGVVLDLADGRVVDGDLLLVATGRRPNGDRLGLPAAGIAARPDGRVAVDEFGRTSAPGVWALGDVSAPYQLKHVANAEARTVAHNLAHPDDLRTLPHEHVPAAVFTEPQIASVGLTERQARATGRDVVVAIQAYGDTAYGWAMEDREGFCKLVADRDTGLLLGAHLIGYQSSTLIQPLIQAMAFGQRVGDVARGQYYIHPALSEVVENALLKLAVVPEPLRP